MACKPLYRLKAKKLWCYACDKTASMMENVGNLSVNYRRDYNDKKMPLWQIITSMMKAIDERVGQLGRLAAARGRTGGYDSTEWDKKGRDLREK